MNDLMEKSDPGISQQSFAVPSESAPEVMYSMRFEEGRVCRYFSNAVEELTGYTAGELCSEQCSWTDIVHPDDKSKYAEAIDGCRRSGGKFSFAYRIRHKNGSYYDVQDRGAVLCNESNEILTVNGLIADVTRQKQARSELEKSQMLQSIGKLSAGIAHEINTPIQFLGDNMRFLDDSFGQIWKLVQIYGELGDIVAEEPAAKEIVGRIKSTEEDIEIDFLREEIPQAIRQSLDGIKLVSKIVSAMRDFSHIDDRRQAAADINKALSSTITILRNELKYVADVNKEFDESLPEIVCCIDEMHQVFLNLLVNAGHSIQEKIDSGLAQRGTVTVKSATEDGNVVISISDTGMGIPPEVRKRVFEPFFTTKQEGRKGTGQGLAMVLSIVQDKHGGVIELDSEPGVGTTFTVRLPIDSASDQNE